VTAYDISYVPYVESTGEPMNDLKCPLLQHMATMTAEELSLLLALRQRLSDSQWAEMCEEMRERIKQIKEGVTNEPNNKHR
jgi:hypothetical protein